MSFAPGEQAQAIRRLKFWAVAAREAESRQAHQGGRGLPPLTAAQELATDAEIDALEALLPPL